MDTQQDDERRIDAPGEPVPPGASLRFYAELNDFLPADRRGREFAVESPFPRTVKDLIESVGIPHTEVDFILVNDEPAGFGCLLEGPARISVYPRFHSLPLPATYALRPPPPDPPRFVADVHLGKLARLLRMLGFDCILDPAADDPELARVSAEDGRILLTRDRGLLKRAAVTHGAYLYSDCPVTQARELCRRYELKRRAQPFARCMSCNGLLARVDKESVRNHVPPRTFRYVDEYLRCDTCGKFFWKGTHWERLGGFLDSILGAGSAAACEAGDPLPGTE